MTRSASLGQGSSGLDGKEGPKYGSLSKKKKYEKKW